MKKIGFSPRWICSQLLSQALELSLTVTVLANTSQGAWLKNDTGWWYCNADRSYPVNQWQYINNYWYFFNASGYMVTGWVQWNNVWYYCCDSGEMLTNTRTPDGYYVDGNGAWIQ